MLEHSSYLVMVVNKGENKGLLHSRMTLLKSKMRQLTYAESCKVQIIQSAQNVSLHSAHQ